MTCSKSYWNIYGSPSLMFLSHRASCHLVTPGASAKANSPSCREGSFSEIGGSKPATRIPADGGLSSGTTCFCCLLPGYSHTCCEGLLRGATAGCSRVAGELVLYSSVHTARSVGYTGLSSPRSGC